MAENKIMIGEEELTEEEVNAGFALLGLCLITIPIISIGFVINVVRNHIEKKELRAEIKKLEEEKDNKKDKILNYIFLYREERKIGNNNLADTWVSGIEAEVREEGEIWLDQKSGVIKCKHKIEK